MRNICLVLISLQMSELSLIVKLVLPVMNFVAGVRLRSKDQRSGSVI